MLASVGLRRRGCGLAVNGGPNRVRHPTDRSFTSWCSPPPLARTQFHSVTAARPATDRDFHPAGSIHLQSHSPPARAGGTAGRWARDAPGSPSNRSPPTRPIRCHDQSTHGDSPRNGGPLRGAHLAQARGEPVPCRSDARSRHPAFASPATPAPRHGLTPHEPRFRIGTPHKKPRGAGMIPAPRVLTTLQEALPHQRQRRQPRRRPPQESQAGADSQPQASPQPPQAPASQGTSTATVTHLVTGTSLVTWTGTQTV